MSADTKFTPMHANGSRVFLNYCGGFDVRNCPEPEALAAFIVGSCNAAAIAPPVAAGSVDTPKFKRLCNALYLANPSLREGERLRMVDHIDAWGAQQREAGYAKKISDTECGALAMLRIERERAEKAEKQWDSWMACANHWQGRAEKAEAHVKEMEAALAKTYPNAIDPSDTPC